MAPKLELGQRTYPPQNTSIQFLSFVHLFRPSAGSEVNTRSFSALRMCTFRSHPLGPDPSSPEMKSAPFRGRTRPGHRASRHAARQMRERALVLFYRCTVGTCHWDERSVFRDMEAGSEAHERRTRRGGLQRKDPSSMDGQGRTGCWGMEMEWTSVWGGSLTKLK